MNALKKRLLDFNSAAEWVKREGERVDDVWYAIKGEVIGHWLKPIGWTFMETEPYSDWGHNNQSRKYKWWIYIVNISDPLAEEYLPQNLLRIFCFFSSNLSWLKYISERNTGISGHPRKGGLEFFRLYIIRLRWNLFVIPARRFFSVKAFPLSKHFGTRL